MATVGGGGGKRKASTGPRNTRTRGGWMADQSGTSRYERGGQIQKRTVRVAPVAKAQPPSDIAKFLSEVIGNIDSVRRGSRAIPTGRVRR